MTTNAVLLLLLSGFIHTIWNGAFKASRNKLCFVWWMVLLCLAYFCPLFCYLFRRHGIPLRGLMVIGLSGICLSLYFLSLSGAYARTHLSLAYPISRGTSPIFVLLLATVILGERISRLGFLGIVLVVLGLYIINMRSGKSFLQAWRDKGVLYALLTALFIATYRIVDKVGVGRVYPPVYYYASLCVVFLFITVVVFSTGQRQAIVIEWQAGKKKILVAGAGLYMSYLIVLYVMTTSKISYVGAAANFGILFSVLWGSLVLKEERGLIRGAGALVVMAGIALIRFGG